MKNNPRDLELLEFIFEHYRSEFQAYDTDDSIRKNKIYVPIDCKMIANKLNADPELVFGRLYYHLANVYKYQQEKNIEAKIFEFEVGGQMHCIHFPILASAVANMKSEYEKHKSTFLISIFAIVVAIGSAVITAFDVFGSKS